ncbi:DUF5336 domain-containing protein [Actinokineospora bangkokensis]|uniref:34 kDa antigenic protein n=1 Tax=Actinokineospora bangkokensis TaxID=1193682 RepID=A0A1Q9LF09_9PSEU|nr:DUF5336 domain-containing protein [Actinokineospora bangkokensis]OLR90549.1 hypothetical protein BJP25_28395 [Actinokineospora bangkokensis]
MTYPGGAPGGYPGQPQPQPHPGYAQPAAPGTKLTPAQILSLVVAGLGLLNLFLGFAPVADVSGAGNASYFGNGLGWIPALLCIGGALCITAVLPGDKKIGLLPPVVVVVTTLASLFSTFTTDYDMGAGAILILIFSLLQTLTIVAAYLFELGVLKPPQPSQQVPVYPHTGQFPPPPGGFNPPSGQFQSPYGQPQPAPGQQPGPGVPPAGQQTTFAPQQGQFGTPPGTPPGGHPQQG